MNVMVLTEEQKKRNGSLFNELAAKLTAAELAFLVTLLCNDPRTLNALLDDATLLGLKQSIGPHLVGAFLQMGVPVDMDEVPPELRPK